MNYVKHPNQSEVINLEKCNSLELQPLPKKWEIRFYQNQPSFPSSWKFGNQAEARRVFDWIMEIANVSEYKETDND